MRFFFALKFLTIIPFPYEARPEELARSQGYFPVVGLLLGLILWGLDYIFGLVFPPALVSALLIVALVILSGAHHLDGFIDTCDGLAVRSSPQERLRVMADSRAGGFGIIGACCLFLVKYLSLALMPLPLRPAALILMPTLSRWSMVAAIFAYPSAKGEGMGHLFKQGASLARVALATLLTLVVALVLMGLSGIIVLLAVGLVTLTVGAYLRSQLGGLSGDGYGAINEIAEVIMLMLIPLVARWNL